MGNFDYCLPYEPSFHILFEHHNKKGSGINY